MENIEMEVLYHSLEEIANGHVYVAVSLMRQYALNHSLGQWRDELESITEDYELMIGYMEKGIVDPDREKIHRRISTRLDRCVRNIILHNMIKTSPFYIEASRKGGESKLETEELRAVLEGFVSEQAMLELLDEEEGRAKTSETYLRHVNDMSVFFHRLIVSPQWSESMGSQMSGLLTSPTIDTFDAQVLISAITLAALNHEDRQKIQALINIYRDATDESVRQRALVGWVFAAAMCDKPNDEVKVLCEDDDVVREISDMQMQVMFCLNAEKDNQLIQKDIIPELMKNQGFNITRFGIIEEKEDDPMEDILNPNAADERVEKLESTMQRMEKMRKEGSDIYFGGFSQMKRFTFFNDMSNWFWPFFTEHPAIQDSLEKIGKGDFIDNLLNSGPFCESDKYSFILSMKTVFDQLPDNIREMMKSGYEMGPVIPDADRNSSAYIRRMYLQDLYRFFRLSIHKASLRNPFADEKAYLFVTSKAFWGTRVEDRLAELAMFMRRRQLASCFKAIAERYLRSHKDANDSDYIHIASLYYFEYMNNAFAAYKILQDAWDRGALSDDTPGLKLFGRVSMVWKDYEMASSCYQRLHELHPDNNNYALNYCVALMKKASYGEALEMLYRLDYESPSANTTRALAWALMGSGKTAQAEALYEKLLQQDQKAPEDYLNAAYCHWFGGDIQNAVRLFREYRATLGSDELPSNWLTKEFEKDILMLETNNMKPVDMMLMADIVEKNTKGTD